MPSENSDWVSTPGITDIRNESHSINEMSNTRANTRRQSEPPLRDQPARDTPEKRAQEPTTSADQKGAAQKKAKQAAKEAQMPEPVRQMTEKAKNILTQLFGGAI